MSNPMAVVISDLHFTVATLELASAALRQARAKAIELGVPLYIAGDTLDSKAIMRGECVNRLLEIFQEQPFPKYTTILVGNHDLINEKGSAHTLNFLSHLRDVLVVDTPVKDETTGVLLIPYQQAGSEVWEGWLRWHHPNHKALIHQGVLGAQRGHYYQDHSAIPVERLQGYVSLGGHYHNHHQIGTHTYVGNPYTLTFGEVNDHLKGFVVWNDDGSVAHVPTNLRKHVILEITTEDLLGPTPAISPDDLLWVKIKGPTLELDRLDKKQIGKILLGHSNFKLDKIYTDLPKLEVSPERCLPGDALDDLIDHTVQNLEQRDALKKLWREAIS